MAQQLSMRSYCSSKESEFGSQDPRQVAHTTCHFSSRGSNRLFWPPKALHQTHTRHTYTYNKKYSVKKEKERKCQGHLCGHL